MHRFRELKQKEHISISHFKRKNKAGEWCWMEATATNRLNDPAVQGIIINARDVTTILNQAREIEHINERYRLAATAIQDLIYDWDLEKNKVIRFNRSLDELLAIPPNR